MSAELATVPQRIVLENVSWATYETLLRAFDERPIRITYDDGSLEIMTLSFGHENLGRFLARLIGVLTLELSLPLASGGSTTLKKRLKRKGLEPDECFWITNAARMRGKKQFRFRRDPPPDLAIEIDISRSSLDRLAIYAALGIGEVWRYTGKRLHVYCLVAEGRFKQKSRSALFPLLPLEKVESFLHRLGHRDENELIREFTEWVRKDLLA